MRICVKVEEFRTKFNLRVKSIYNSLTTTKEHLGLLVRYQVAVVIGPTKSIY